MNYQVELDKVIDEIKQSNKIPTLLLHSCCAPCSSYVLEYLSEYFLITILYYNPNISPISEYEKRLYEQKRLINELKVTNKINILDCSYDNDLYNKAIKGLEEEPERGKRCIKCYEMRLEKCAEIAKENNFDYFCTTLTVSPYKSSIILNQIGQNISQKYNIKYLFSDFKKREGYKRSIELSKKYNLYRQNYCGCIYSKNIINN